MSIDGVYMGSCTGGKTEDFLAAAQLMATSGSIISSCDYIQGAESSEVHTPSRNQKESSSLKSSELQLVTLGLMIVLCWVGCFSAGPNSEGANFLGSCNSKDVVGFVYPACTGC